MAFNKTDLDNIKSKILISSELEKKTKIIKKGKDIWCCCPFHNEKTPSCKINDDLGSFYCFGCGAKGDIFTIYQDLFNYTFLDAVKELSERAGVKINFDTKSSCSFNRNSKTSSSLFTINVSTNLKLDLIRDLGLILIDFLSLFLIVLERKQTTITHTTRASKTHNRNIISFTNCE